MRVVIAPDSFKESLTAKEVALAIEKGFKKVYPEAEYDLMPVSDGGEGTLAILSEALSLSPETHWVTGPFGEPIEATYARKGEFALFEMATVVGLESIPFACRNPLLIQTRGIGELLIHLVQSGVRHILIGVGGSASHDGGIGMAAGLGYVFLDQAGQVLDPIGANLGKVARIKKGPSLPNLEGVRIELVTDVSNRLCGSEGATYIFAGQKGLDQEHFAQADADLERFYRLCNQSLLSLAGGGAGGGMAAGLAHFAGAHLLPGIELVLDLLAADQRLAQADLVIVGEGRLDRQSLAGKTPIGVARRTPEGVPVIAICGSLKADLPAFPFENICAAFPIIAEVESLADTLRRAEENLVRTAEQVARLLQLGAGIEKGKQSLPE